MLNKNELLAKGNELIDKINAAISQIEICESAKEKIASPEAIFSINFYDGKGGFKPYDLHKVLPEDSIEKIKAFIMTEFDLQTAEAMNYIEQLEVAPVLSEQKAEYYIPNKDDSVNTEEFFLPDDEENISAEVSEEKHSENKITRNKPSVSDKELIRMYIDEGMTYGDIANATGMGKSTVARHVKEYMDTMKKECASKGKEK